MDAFFFRDNYGFITFKYKVDAYEAIEHGNDDPSYPTVDLCFGGRRAFCKEKYSDLGKSYVSGCIQSDTVLLIQGTVLKDRPCTCISSLPRLSYEFLPGALRL